MPNFVGFADKVNFKIPHAIKSLLVTIALFITKKKSINCTSVYGWPGILYSFIYLFELLIAMM